MRIADDILIRKDGAKLPVEINSAPFDTHDGITGSVVVFTDTSERKRAERRMLRDADAVSWVGRVRDALAKRRFVVYAQPIVEVATRAVVRHELLIRMLDDSGKIIAPGLFLPAAEKYGLVADIDRWMLGQAVELAAEGHAVAVNLSAYSVGAPRILATIEAALQRTGADPSLIVVELTETALLEDGPGRRAPHQGDPSSGEPSRHRRFRHRVRRLHLPQAAALRLPEDRCRVRPRPARQRREPARRAGRRQPARRGSDSRRSPRASRTTARSRCSASSAWTSHRATRSHGRPRRPRFLCQQDRAVVILPAIETDRPAGSRDCEARILVVCPQPASLRNLAGLIRSWRCGRVLESTESEAVAGLCAELQPDLVVLDLGASAHEAIEVLAHMLPQNAVKTPTPVLVLTSAAGVEARCDVFRAGASDVVLKPANPEELRLRVGQLLDTRRVQEDLRRHGELVEHRVRTRVLDLDRARLEALAAAVPRRRGPR